MYERRVDFQNNFLLHAVLSEKHVCCEFGQSKVNGFDTKAISWKDIVYRIAIKNHIFGRVVYQFREYFESCFDTNKKVTGAVFTQF